MAEILFERRDGLAVVTLNRPEARNSITPDMVRQFTEFLQNIEGDHSVRCVLLRGTGEHFMSGGDVRSFSQTLEMTPNDRRRMFEARVQAVTPLMLTMERMPQILVAAVKGACAGAGVSWVAAADLAIAARSSFFLQAQIRIGATPDGGGSYWLPRAMGLKRAKEIALLGDRFSAEEAERWGLVNRVVDDGQLDQAAEDLALRIASGPAAALARAKRLFNASAGNSYAEQLQLEAEAFSQSAADADFGEGLRGFLEKRAPRFGS